MIGEKKPKNPSFNCRASTDLYPNWTIFSTPELSAEEARKVVVKLLSMPEQKGKPHWSVVSDFSSTDNLYKSLKIGPYSYLRHWTWEKIRNEFGGYIGAAVLLLMGLIFHHCRESYLLNKRTKQLRRALRRRRESERKSKVAQTKLQVLEKAGAIGQISSIVAHELRQPLSTIMNFSHGLQRHLEKKDINTDMVSEGLSKIEQQAQKAEMIVSQVREYAKGKVPRRKELNLKDLLRSTIKMINDSKLFSIPVVMEEDDDIDIFVQGDPLELELCVVNIIKNAQEVSVLGDSVFVRTRLKKEEQERKTALISISDNGPCISDETFKKSVNLFSRRRRRVWDSALLL